MLDRKNGCVRFVSVLVLALFVSEISFPVLGTARAEAAWDALDGTAPRKEKEVALDDEQRLDNDSEIIRKVNVLIMAEATAGMEFSTTSAMPTVVLAGDSEGDWTLSGYDGAGWKATKDIYVRTPNDINNMMAGATFGIGAMPVAWSGCNLEPGRNLYGRDLDESNNVNLGRGNPQNLDAFIELYKNDYYFPFKNGVGDIPKGYEKQTNGLEIGYEKYENALSSSISHYNLNDKEVGTRVIAPYAYTRLTSHEKFPYALVFKDPKYWENGWRESYAPKSSDLVPNDSRLYQAKLVLWNLMENEDIWDNIRFGLASTFLPHTNEDTRVSDGNGSPYGHTGLSNRFDFSGLYKVHPFGANAHTHSTFIAENGDREKMYILKKQNDSLDENKTGGTKDKVDWKRWKFDNGVLVQSISGNVRGYNALHAQMYPMYQHMTNELIYSRITSSKYGADFINMKRMYQANHRASLLVPMREYNDRWVKDGRPEMTQAERFKLWIDGFADLYNGTVDSSPAPKDSKERSKQWHYYKNPEIGVAGVFVLPHAIYPDPRSAHEMSRVNYRSNVYTTDHSARGNDAASAVWYSHKSNNTNYDYSVFPGSSELENDESGARAHFNGGSGEAAGSILDFFSPPTNKYGDLIPEQYPIRSSCEDNWVILITTGQEVKPEDGDSYEYTAAQAIKNLYDATNKETKDKTRTVTSGRFDFSGGKIYADYERMSMLVRDSKGNVLSGSNNPRLVDLDNPIRTMVVGMIPDPAKITDTALKAEVTDMKLNLTRMAVAGRGGDPGSVTLENMNDPNHAQPYLAYSTETLMDAIMGALATINDSSVMQPAKGVVAQARAISGLGDTSELFTYKYKIMRSDQWKVELKRYVANTNKDGNLVLTYRWELDKYIRPGTRNLQYWKHKQSNEMPHGWTLDSLEAKDSDFAELTGLVDTEIDPPSSDTDFTELSPSDALIKWFNGSDVSYLHRDNNGRPIDYGRSHLLTDFGQGGIVVVQDPIKDANFLPGYREWAETAPRQESILYGQTNDGILHVINQENGLEQRAILPPPSLVPGRLAVLTTHPPLTEDGKRRWLNILGPEGGQRSFPAYILDGALQKRDFNLNQTGEKNGWGSYLLGALGRGGSGLYALDVTDHDNPKLMWYRERIGHQLAKWHNGVIDASVPAMSDADSAFLKLGFNSPRPAVSVAPKTSDNPKTGYQNFIALAGGAQHDVNFTNNGNDGAVFLLLDPKDGSVIKSFESASVEEGWRNGSGDVGSAPYMGMMVSEPTLVRSCSSVSERNFLTGRVLTADNRGNIFSVDTESEDGGPLASDAWKIRTIASLSLSNTGDEAVDSHSIPHGITAGNSRGYCWAAGGTADIQLLKPANTDGNEGFIKNSDQLMFAFKLLRETKQSDLLSGRQNKFFSRSSDFEQLDTEKPDSVYNPDDADHRGGWYMPLRTDAANAFAEYVSAKPVIIHGTLYVATFIQKNKTGADDSSVCASTRAIDGNSRLFAVDVATGGGNTWDPVNGKRPKYIEFSGVKIVSLTDMKEGGRNKLLINFDILNETDNDLHFKLTNQTKLKGVLFSASDDGNGNGDGGDGDGDGDGDDDGGGATLDEDDFGSEIELEPNTNVTQYWIKY